MPVFPGGFNEAHVFDCELGERSNRFSSCPEPLLISYYECCTKLGFEGIHNEPERLLAFERQPRAFWE